MTKILFTVTTDLNSDQRMQRICQTLSDEGYDVTLIGRKQQNSKPLIKCSYKQKRLSCYFQKGKFFYLEYNIGLFLNLLFRRADIICAVDLDTLLPSFIMSRLRGKQFVFDAHEYYTESANLINRKFEQGIWKRLESWILPKVKYAYTVNQSIAELFEKEYGTKFEVVRNVPNYQESVAESLDNLIVYQGAVRAERGLDGLIKAMRNINAKLIIAGGGVLLDDLKLLAKEIGVEDKIEFTGQCSPDELREISSKATIGISPLEPIGFNHLYSLSNKFLEYIQLEVPQVAMNFEEYRRINDEFEVAKLIDDIGESNFTNSINQLLSDKSLYSKLKTATTVAKKELNWNKEKEVLLEFYNSID